MVYNNLSNSFFYFYSILQIYNKVFERILDNVSGVICR